MEIRRYLKRKPLALILAGLFSIAGIGAIANQAVSDESIFVSATVGLFGVPPTVTAITPGLDTITVLRNTSQSVSLTVSDTDDTGSGVVYSISVATGAVSPQNGKVKVVSGVAHVDFTYFAPAYKAKLVPVTVTLNDQSGLAPTVKVVNLYVY